MPFAFPRGDELMLGPTLTRPRRDGDGATTPPELASFDAAQGEREQDGASGIALVVDFGVIHRTLSAFSRFTTQSWMPPLRRAGSARACFLCPSLRLAVSAGHPLAARGLLGSA
jgi:hypothetical protein